MAEPRAKKPAETDATTRGIPGVPASTEARKRKSAPRRTKAKAPVSEGSAGAGDESAGESGGESGGRGKSGGKHLVIVESPAKARTINKYLGSGYTVMASVGHVRDLPSRAPKGVKQEVPGVDIAHDFAPTYEILPDKKKTVAALRKAAKGAADVWFATDLDREGEAIAWHLAQALDVPVPTAKRVVFNAITRTEIQNAFARPRNIDEAKVNAQQARRILDRLVGYQVSPLLWKKVAGGLSAGRVQSVATRLVVEREQEIDAFLPEEYWKIAGYFAVELAKVAELRQQWLQFLQEGKAEQRDSDDGREVSTRTLKDKLAWLSARGCLRAELVEIDGQPFKPTDRDQALTAAKRLGLAVDKLDEWQDAKAKGPARFLARVDGHVADQLPAFTIQSIATKRTTTRPSAPFITSTLQQTASTQLGFPLQRTMRIAQQLYEGIDLRGVEGQTGLITYMRTDSTHISGEALEMARQFISKQFGASYLPEKPNFFTSSNKAAQEAHEAIRPTDLNLTPSKVRSALNDEQFKLYELIWRRFVACQMTSAQWDSTTVMIAAANSGQSAALFKATGRTLVFDGFYKVVGVPNNGDEPILPVLREQQQLSALQIDPTQHFTSPPPRYTEASLQKKLEEEGIGRPSTYAAIISTIQDRQYVQQLSQRDRRLFATDLGKVVTQKLVEAFPTIMDVAYTRKMEAELDKIEEEHHDWVAMLRDFYGPFKQSLDLAHGSMTHAKAEMEPAPFPCAKCGASTVYRFGKNGRFLSCSRYPACDYAAPIDREGNPQAPELSDIVCPLCGKPMNRRVGRFGPFLSCTDYPTCKGVVRLDPRKGTVVLPKPPPLITDLPCPKCGQMLALRRSKRGPWLSCSKYPKCRGRLGWSAVDPAKQQLLETALAQHEQTHPVPEIKTSDGRVIGNDYLPQRLGGAETPVAAPAADDTAEAL